MYVPKIAAQFALDPQGKPIAITHGATRHYNIRLQVHGAPDDTYAVTYQLDDSYYDRVREARDKDSAFAEDLTSYGDYTVQAKVRTKHGILTVAVPLSEALKEGHAGDMSPAITQALAEIQAK